MSSCYSFNQGEIVVEYVGELIRNQVADLREKKYKEQGFGDCYMFRVDKDSVIDASFKGNQARYLNHSCEVIPLLISLSLQSFFPIAQLQLDYR